MVDDSPGTWQLRFRLPDGDRMQVALGTFPEVPAHERFDKAAVAARLCFAHHSGTGRATRSALTVGDACDAYVIHTRELKGERAAKDLTDRYRRWLSNDPVNKIELAKLSRDQLKAFRARLVGTPVKINKKGDTRARSKDTVNRDMAVLRAALNLAFAEGKAASDAAWRESLKAFKGAGRRRGLYLDREQRRSLIEAAPSDIALFLKGMAMLPLRPGALAALQVRDFDSKLGVLTVGHDKSGRNRKIKLPPEGVNILDAARRGKEAHAPLFTRIDGVPWNKDSWYLPIKEAARAASLPSSTSAYTLRHSVITDLVHGGLDLLTVAQISGTSVAMIEKHYGHLRADIAASALARLVL
jgi:integrase